MTNDYLYDSSDDLTIPMGEEIDALRTERDAAIARAEEQRLRAEASERNHETCVAALGAAVVISSGAIARAERAEGERDEAKRALVHEGLRERAQGALTQRGLMGGVLDLLDWHTKTLADRDSLASRLAACEEQRDTANRWLRGIPRGDDPPRSARDVFQAVVAAAATGATVVGIWRGRAERAEREVERLRAVRDVATELANCWGTDAPENVVRLRAALDAKAGS